MNQSTTRTRTRRPRTGRRPGPSPTRQEILTAAGKLFAERGYTGTTMRAIGAEAGVDASLVVHFFGNKAALLAEAVEWPFDPEVELPRLLSDGRRNVGKRLVELFVRSWDEEGRRNAILTLLHAAMIEPAAAELIREYMRLHLFQPLKERLGVDQAELRSELAASQILGLGIARYVLRFEPLTSASSAEVIGWVAPTIQRYLTGRIQP